MAFFKIFTSFCYFFFSLLLHCFIFLKLLGSKYFFHLFFHLNLLVKHIALHSKTLF